MPLPSDTRAFVQRWRQKGTEYKFEPLDECFDRFFTAFVLYNCLYNIVTDRERYEFRHDYDKAVKVVPKFLTADDLYRDQVVRREAAKLVSLIEHRTFYVREKVWDDLRISKLRTADSEQWVAGLLEIVYQIRCNAFHGQKPFDPEQRQILEPCVRILEHVNDKLVEKLDR